MKKVFLLLSVSLLVISSCSSGSGRASSDIANLIKDEKDFQHSCNALDANNEMLYRLFELAKANDNLHAAIWYEEAMKVKHQSRALSEYILDVKSELKSKSANVDRKIADTLRTELLDHPDDKKVIDDFLKAKELKERLVKYHDALVAVVDKDGRAGVASRISGLACGDVYSFADSKTIPWEDYQFSGATLAAALARLTAIEQQVKIAEGIAVNELYHHAISVEN